MFRTWYPRTVARSQSLVYSQKRGLGRERLSIFRRFEPRERTNPLAATPLHNPLKIRLKRGAAQ